MSFSQRSFLASLIELFHGPQSENYFITNIAFVLGSILVSKSDFKNLIYSKNDCYLKLRALDLINYKFETDHNYLNSKLEKFLNKVSDNNREIFFGGIFHIPLIILCGKTLKNFNCKLIELDHVSRKPYFLDKNADKDVKNILVLEDIGSAVAMEELAISISVSYKY
jgi:hypothetical protein